MLRLNITKIYTYINKVINNESTIRQSRILGRTLQPGLRTIRLALKILWPERTYHKGRKC
jgi:hypothetical protein